MSERRPRAIWLNDDEAKALREHLAFAAETGLPGPLRDGAISAIGALLDTETPLRAAFGSSQPLHARPPQSRFHPFRPGYRHPAATPVPRCQDCGHERSHENHSKKV